MKAKIYITLKRGVLDPQGKAIQQSLHTLGFEGVDEVRVGKFIEIKLPQLSAAAAKEKVNKMCEKLLANTVVESFHFDLES